MPTPSDRSDHESATSARRTRGPWPMKWVALAILVCIVPYTWISLRYRKEAPSYEPAQAQAGRAGNHQHLVLEAEHPAPPRDELPPDAFIIGRAMPTPIPAGLPEGLLKIIGIEPRLPESVAAVSTPAEVTAMAPVRIRFSCRVASDRDVLGGTEIYIKENAIVILPTFEELEGELAVRSRNEPVLVTLPAGILKAGVTYDVRLMAASNGFAWNWVVR
ncbi:MAG: hypothetical protein LBK99_06125 [Opitutaceae bacterium]|nr:hypothetical protein [Opitutaceae bacterium]